MCPIFQNSYYNGWGYQQPYYPAVPNQDIDDKNSTTAEPEPEVVGFFQDFDKRLLIQCKTCSEQHKYTVWPQPI